MYGGHQHLFQKSSKVVKVRLFFTEYKVQDVRVECNENRHFQREQLLTDCIMQAYKLTNNNTEEFDSSVSCDGTIYSWTQSISDRSGRNIDDTSLQCMQCVYTLITACNMTEWMNEWLHYNISRLHQSLRTSLSHARCRTDTSSSCSPGNVSTCSPAVYYYVHYVCTTVREAMPPTAKHTLWRCQYRQTSSSSSSSSSGGASLTGQTDYHKLNCFKLKWLLPNKQSFTSA